jgi:DNA-binding CsgD family transcriptional regulator
MGNVAPQHHDIESLSLDDAQKLLRAMTVRELRYTSLLRRAADLMKSLQPIATGNGQQQIATTVNEITSALDTTEQERFAFVLETMQGAFLQKLAQDFPTLTPTELRLAVFLRLPMPSREVARLFSCSVRSVEKHRERMRKKFGLSPNENLTTFLASRD